MAPEEKPYRVYRGGRRGPKLPTLSRSEARERPACTPQVDQEGARTAAVATRAALARHRLLDLRPLGRRLEPRRLLLVPRRREGGEQAAAGLGREAAVRPGRPAVDGVEDDPPARDRHPAGQGPARTTPLRLDDARAHRSRPSSPLLPLDPARPVRGHPRLRREPDQHVVPGRRRRARDPHGARVHGDRCRPRRDCRLPALQGAHRLDRRHRHQRAPADQVQPLRVPVRRAALPDLGRLAVLEGPPAHGRPPRARLLANPRQPAGPVGERHHAVGAPAAGHAGDRGQARRRRHVPPHAVQRGRAAAPARRPTSARTSCFSSAG